MRQQHEMGVPRHIASGTRKNVNTFRQAADGIMYNFAAMCSSTHGLREVRTCNAALSSLCSWPGDVSLLNAFPSSPRCVGFG